MEDVVLYKYCKYILSFVAASSLESSSARFQEAASKWNDLSDEGKLEYKLKSKDVHVQEQDQWEIIKKKMQQMQSLVRV